jgi:4-hydroxyphenylpyruvate dioxygenase
VGGDEEEDIASSFSSSSSFAAIDHIVLNVSAGDLERAVTWYEKILDFQPQQTFNIQTARSALYSQVMVSGNGDVQLPINEPASANSQIQEFLNVNRGAGIQHIALRTRNIVHAIAQFRASGLSLLPVPKGYYLEIQQRKGLPLSTDELDAIAAQEILVDWKENTFFGSNNIIPVLLQIFTQPIFSQPTFFFEFIERRYQAQGFGEGNFRALFAAIENEQIKRGSLKDFG